jgi:hypothetical protein
VNGSTAPAPGARRPLVWILAIVLTVGGAILLAHEWPTRPAASAASPQPPDPVAELTFQVPVRRVGTARTDAGRPVPLGGPDRPRGADAVGGSELRVLRGLGFIDRVARRAPASDESNCHGWVFAGGRFWVLPRYVEAILQGNGYRPVADPRPGDLAVYRGPDGTVWHSAVVRAARAGAVRVESKWAWMGVYEHDAADTPFGTAVEFYRSPRAGHELAGLPTAAN